MAIAYDKIYLEQARRTLGSMLDYAVNSARLETSLFWNMFLVSDISKRFEVGESAIVAGKSGIELAQIIITDENSIELPDENDSIAYGKSREYWAGWVLAYYQWKNGCSFKKINGYIPITQILEMYSRYHEADIEKLCDRLDEIIFNPNNETNLKQIRLMAGLSQRELAIATGISVRSIQQYEQRRKNINSAKAETIFLLARALHCRMEELLEIECIRKSKK
ncbi:MAG: helix-turn-helix transcriptional regulator [Eubacteriales bacterium]|nr:helix-turn-helix transcriptional regulator [Eubacteriales bacterium]